MLIVGCDQNKMSQQTILLNNFILLNPLIFDYAKSSNSPILLKEIKAKIVTSKVETYHYRFNKQGLVTYVEVIDFNKKGQIHSKTILQFNSNNTWDLIKYLFESSLNEWRIVGKHTFVTDKRGLINKENISDITSNSIANKSSQIFYFYKTSEGLDSFSRSITTYPYLYTEVTFKVNNTNKAFSYYKMSINKVKLLSSNQSSKLFQNYTMRFNSKGNADTDAVTVTGLISRGPVDKQTFHVNACAMLDINDHGDWLEKRCQNGAIITRQLTY